MGYPGARDTGSVIILDSVISGTDTAVLVPTPRSGDKQQQSLVLDNLKVVNVDVIVKTDGGVKLLSGGTTTITSWGIGKKYANTAGTGTYVAGDDITPHRTIDPSLLGGPNHGIFERSRPQYESTPVSGFTDVCNNGAKGDGTTDDTDAINTVLAKNAGKSIVYFPAGTYIVTDTIFVPVGSKIVGEAWSQIMATGPKFADMRNPKVMVQVGKPGDAGVIEITDMLFTVRGATAGAVLMEWNVKQRTPGSAAMWDSHFRVGGSIGSNLQNANCPKLTGVVNDKCIAGSMLLHLTKSSSAYLENVWMWVADHDLDIPAQTQIDIYVARGTLIQSQGPTWMYGTASEHCTLYQYQLCGVKNLFMGMIQTETPYWQSTPRAPEPFTPSLNKFPDDPTFSDCPSGSLTCAMAWGLRIISSSNIYTYGAGLYSFFNSYNQECLDSESCQDDMVEIIKSTGLWFYNFITKASTNSISPRGGRAVPQSENHFGFGSTIVAWLTLSGAI